MPDLLERLKAALADRYAVESEVGRGGMAVVFKAEDIRHRRQVAIKVLHPELTATLGAERFLHEIEIVAGLQHPHILPLYESGEADGLLFYVMPYAEGESLRQRLDREKQLAVDESVRIAVEVADGLDYAHRKGVVHRDVKPGNILLSERHAVIADFGIARAIEVARAERVTSTGLGVGTPLYASPEQATAQETLDGRTDIYSLGCVLYEMLAGEPPLMGSTPEMIRARRLSETPTALHTLRDTVPPALDHVIARALARIPADRYATAAQFGQALQAVLFTATPAAMGDLAATPGSLSSIPTTVGPRMRKVSWWPVGVLVVAAAAVGAWLLTQRAEPRGEEATSVGGGSVERYRALTDRGDVQEAAISPDGREIAYCTQAGFGRGRTGVATLWIQPLDEPEAVRELLTLGGCRIGTIQWTADGSQLVFEGAVQGQSGTYIISRRGTNLHAVSCGSHGNFALSPDGTRCAGVILRGKEIVISPLDSEGSSDTILIEGDYDGLRVKAWLAESDRLAFEPIVGLTLQDSGTIWTVNTDGTDRRPVVTLENPFEWAWSPDGRGLYYWATAGRDMFDLMRIPTHADGSLAGEPELLFSDRRVPFNQPGAAQISVDGKIAVVGGSRLGRVVRLERDRASRADITLVHPVTEWKRYRWLADVSTDGQWILYQDREGIYRVPASGGDSHLVEAGAVGAVFSPDGKYVAYRGEWEGGWRTFIGPIDGYSRGVLEEELEPDRPTIQWRGDYVFRGVAGQTNVPVIENLQVWSREQREWVAIGAVEPIDADFSRGVRAESRWLLPNDSVGTFMSVIDVSPDGGQFLVLWIRTSDGSRMTDSTAVGGHWLLSPDGSDQTELTLPGGPLGWTPDGEGLFVIERKRTERGVLSVYRLDDGESTGLWRLSDDVGECYVRPGVEPVELICDETKRVANVLILENFDPHVN